jgi:hypothetical protein
MAGLTLRHYVFARIASPFGVGCECAGTAEVALMDGTNVDRLRLIAKGRKEAMSNPQRVGKDTIGKDKSAGRDDPKGWEHGAKDTLRDEQGGTYGTLPGRDDPEQVKEHSTDRERAQSGADLRPVAEPVPGTLPEGLQRRPNTTRHKSET